MFSKKNKYRFVILLVSLFIQIGTYAQQEEVIDHKGTKVTVRNTVVTTAATAPSNPLQNDIWFDTTAEITKIFNGSTWVTINLDALAKKEDSANKSSDVNLSDATNTKFPTELAVKTYVDTELATVAGENLYTNDGVLTSNRTITQNSFDLNFDSNTLVVSGNDNRVGIGTDSPSQVLDVNGNTRIRVLNTGSNTDDVVTTDADGNLRKLPITSLETKTSISQNSSSGIITHNSEDGSSQSVNLVSTDTNNSITAGTDGGAYYNNPIKAYGTLIPATNTFTAVGISGATKNAIGRYTFTMATSRTGVTYPIQLSILDTSMNDVNIYVTAQTTTTFSIAIVQVGLTASYVDRTCYFTILDF